MISLELYTPRFDGDLRDWLTARNLDTEVIRELPYTGYVALLRGTPIASGFLRLCEGGFGLLDSYLTNPDAPPGERSEALDLITNQLVKHAKQLELKQIIALTLDKNTHVRAQRHGMIATSHLTLVMPLTSKGE